MAPPRTIADPVDLILTQLVEQVYPITKTIGLPQALRAITQWPHTGQPPSKSSLKSLADELETACHQWKIECPALVAVTGLKNAGKSSLVRSFISPQGRKRLPIGLARNAATRRYVFWFPETLRPQVKSDPFRQMLKDVFGSLPEELDANPEKAAAQYRGDHDAQGMRLPLIAFDSGLDQWRVGLLDCPDIETGDGLNDPLLQQTREMLQKVAHLCSAYIIVAQYEYVEVNDLWHIANVVSRMANGSEVFLAINKCPPKSFNDIYDDVRDVATSNTFNLAQQEFKLHFAYDFTKRGCERFPVRLDGDAPLPAGAAVGDEEPDEFEDLLPTFVSWESGAPMPPSPLSSERLLVTATRKLSPDKLQVHYRQQLGRRINQLVCDAVQLASTAIKGQDEKVQMCTVEIVQALLEVVTPQGGAPAPLVNHSLVREYTAIIIDEAPHGLRQLLQAQLVIVNMAEQIRRKLQIIPPERIRNWLKGHSYVRISASLLADKIWKTPACFNLIRIRSQDALESAVEQTFERFRDEFVSDVSAIRPCVRKYYDEMSWGRYAWACGKIVGALMVMLGLAMLIPLDGGATTVAYGVGVIELLAAAGILVAINDGKQPGILVDLQKRIVEAQVGYLAGVIARKCGLPPMQNSTVAVKFANGEYKIDCKCEDAGNTEVPDAQLSAYRIVEDTLHEVMKGLNGLGEQEGQG